MRAVHSCNSWLVYKLGRFAFTARDIRVLNTKTADKTLHIYDEWMRFRTCYKFLFFFAAGSNFQEKNLLQEVWSVSLCDIDFTLNVIWFWIKTVLIIYSTNSTKMQGGLLIIANAQL